MSRLAIVFKGSPLFTGVAGSGESNIRKWIIENDWLEAIIGLPDQLFYNTGISTYIWILTNRKRRERQGKMQLVNAVSLFRKMRKSLGNKPNEIAPEQIEGIVRLYGDFEEGRWVKIFRNEEFGYRQITIERPLRLRYEATGDGIERALASKPIQVELAGDDGTKRQALAAVMREAAAQGPLEGKTATKAIEAGLLPPRLALSPAEKKALVEGLAVRDESAPSVTKNGKPDDMDSDKSAVPGVNRNVLHRLPVPMLPLNQQRAILGAIEHADLWTRRIVTASQAELDLIQERRQGPIPAAVTGQIGVR
jgi:type I restriction enzyme M protein